MMKKRVLSLILAVLMVLSVLPVMTLSIGAEEPEAATPATIDYFDLYVTDGIVGWFRIEDTYLNEDGTSKKTQNGVHSIMDSNGARYDYLDNVIWIYNQSYESTHSSGRKNGLQSGRVFYYGGFLDKAIDKEDDASNNNKIENDFTVEAVLNSTAANGTTNGWFIQAGVFGLQSAYAGKMRRQLSSWNVKTGSAYNTVNLNVYEDASMYQGSDNPWATSPNRLFSYTLKHDIEVSETPYKYNAEDGNWYNTAGDKLPLNLNYKDWAQNIMTEVQSGSNITKYLVSQDADQNDPASYRSVNYFDEEAGIYKRLCAVDSGVSNFNNYLVKAGVLGDDGLQAISVDNALAKSVTGEDNDLPYDGYVTTYEYIDGVRYMLARSDAPVNSIFPFVYGTYGDDFNGDGTNKQETLWNGQMFTSGTVTDGSERQFGTSNLFVGASNVKVDQIRLYDRLITDAEMYQNHFADIARLKTLDKEALALLVTLPAEAQAEVHLAFKDIQVSTTLTTDELNDKLYKAISAAYIVRYDAVTSAEVAFKTLATGEYNLLDYIALPAFNKDLVNAKVLADAKETADQAYFDDLFAAYTFDYSGYEETPEMFKEDLFDIYVEATSQEAIDKAEAVYAGIDFAEFNALNETLQAKVEEAMASDMAALKALAIAGDLDGAQAWLDTKVEAAVDAVYSDYDALYVKDGLYSHLSFLETNEANNTDAWLNVMADGEAYADKGANEELKKYIKVNTAQKDYTFSQYGLYYKTLSGNLSLYPTAEDPAVVTADKIQVVAGNTLRHGEGFILSPWHAVGYYTADEGASNAYFAPTVYNPASSLAGAKLDAGQLWNTYINVPEIDTTKDHTVQLVASVNNMTNIDADMTNRDVFNYHQAVRGTKIMSLSFFELHTSSWMYNGGYNVTFTHEFYTREFNGSAWASTKIGSLYNFGNGYPYDEAINSKEDNLSTYKDYWYYNAKDLIGIPYNYTIVSDVVTNDIASGDNTNVSNISYAAKANVTFYYGNKMSIGNEFFGRFHDDDLAWTTTYDLTGDTDYIGHRGGLAIYAFRLYDRALSESELLQNRFADIATFYHLDLRTYYNVAEADRIDAVKAFLDSITATGKQDLQFATTGTGKTRKSAEIEELYEAAFAAFVEVGKTVKYTEFYVTDGLKTHLNFLEATEANNTADWLSVVMPDGNGGYTYSNLSTANAILETYELVENRGGSANNSGTYALASDIYGKYFKTESGGYSYAPTAEDPAVLDASGRLITYPGNTFMFGDGYIWSPYRDSGYYRTAGGDIAEIDAATMSVINESGLPFGDTSARALSYQRQSSSHLYIPSQNYAPYLPKQNQNGTYQFVMAFNVGGDGEASTANSKNSDQNLKTPHIDISFNGSSGYSRATYKGASVADNVWSATWGGKTIYKGYVAQNEVMTLTTRIDIVDNNIPAEYVLASGTDSYVARANYTFYAGIGNVWLNNASFTNQPVIDGTRWLSNNAPSIWNRTEVGYGGGTKIFAIRVYNRAISDDEIIQNQFADVVGFYHLDASAMLEVSKDAWDEMYPIFKDVKLDDDTVDVADLQAQLDAKALELSGNGAVELIEFEGYQARNQEYNGLRALYTVNEEKLAELEALGYTVEFGAILAIAGERTAEDIVGSVVDGEFNVSVDKAQKVEVYNNGEYTGKTITNKTTGETQFACTITFKGASAAAANYESDLIFRSYAVVTKDGKSIVVYPDNSSTLFDDALNLKTVANAYYEAGQGYYKLIQDLLGACGTITLTGKNYTINGRDLADYTIVPSADTMAYALAIREAIKTATGYTLPIANKAVKAGLAINIAHDTALADGAWSVDFDGNEVTIGGHGVQETFDALNEFIASFPAVGGAIPTVQITPKTDVALAGYSVTAEEGVEPSFVNEFTAAITNKCGDILDGTSGKSITICAPDTENFYSDSYKISLNDGNIVVEGGSQETLELALEILLTTLTDTGFRMNTIGYEKEHAYEQANLAINNELIKNYKIVADTKVFGAKIAAEYLQDEIKAKTGKELAIVSESDGPAFVIDIKTNDEGKYFIDAEDSKITLSGAGANGAYTAAKALVKKIGSKTTLTVADSSDAMFTLNNTAYKLRNDKSLKAAMWGDSVGEASGCIAPAVLLGEMLQRDFPEADVDMINPSLGGRHSAWGVYHIDEEIIDKGNLDLVMISLGTNDAPYGIKYEQSLLNYQSMIEKIRRANPNADIVFIMYGRIHEVYAMKNGNYEVAYMKAMFEIADYYNIPIVDTVHKMDELTGASKNSDANTNTAWQYYYADTVHPNQTGYNLYADIYYQSIKAAIDAAAGTQLITPVMPEPMNENSKIDTERYYAHLGEDPSAAELIGLTYAGGWQENSWTYTADSTASFSFTGTGIELYLSNHGTPIYEVVITDKNGEVVFTDTKTYNSWWYDPQMNLPYGDYDVVITAKNASVENSLRITYINVKGAKK